MLAEWHDIQRHRARLSYSASIGDTAWSTDSDGKTDPEVLRFQRLIKERLDDLSLNIVPLGLWLNWHGFDQSFRDNYLTPILVVLFVTDEGLYELSTRFVIGMMAGRIKFLDLEDSVHGWNITGGSTKYYEAVTESFKDRIRLETPVSKIERRGDRVRVTAYLPGGGTESEWYDEVILAVPADVALSISDRPSWGEEFLLSEVRYTEASVALHSDARAIADNVDERN